MIRVESVSFSYGKRKVIDNLSFSVQRGECVAVAGPNGSGKSTLLSLLNGVLTPCSGKIQLNGKIGFVPQGNALFEDLTVLENILFFAKLAGAKIPDKLPFSVEQMGARKVCQLSGGMKKQVSIACALVGDAEIVLLDEPCTALDITFRDETTEMVKAWKTAGKTVVYVGHEPAEFYPTFDKLLLLGNEATVYGREKLCGDCKNETQFEAIYKDLITISRK